MLKPPPKAQLRHSLRKMVTLNKYIYTGGEDAYGQKTRTLSATYTIEAEIQEITVQDIMYIQPGLAAVGDAYGFFLSSYYRNAKQVSVEVSDEIIWNEHTWRVDNIESFYHGSRIWYKRAYMRRVT